jgi:PAS domain S-box-containing protein
MASVDPREKAADCERFLQTVIHPERRTDGEMAKDIEVKNEEGAAETKLKAEAAADAALADLLKPHERARVDAQLNDALRLHEVSTLLVQEGDLDTLHNRILDAAIGLMSADMASLQIFHPEQRELRLLAWRGFHPASAAFWERVRFNSASTCGLALSAGCRVVVPDVETCDAIAGTADLDAYRRSDIRAVQSTPLISRSGQLLGMISTHWREPHQPAEHELRLFDVLARQSADLIERTKAEAALRESEERFRQLASIVEFSDDAIVSKNLDSIILTWNKGAERLFGYSANEVIGKPVTILMPPERLDEESAILKRIRCDERVEHYETVRCRKDGSLVDISLTVSPIKNAQGKVVGASKIARDITDRKRSEAQLAILAREAEHRAKNVLASVQATVHLSQSDTPAGLKAAIEGRIQALANVHALFVQSRWTGADLRDLVRQELSPYFQSEEARTRIDGPSVLLEPEVAQSVAVILHELATNAAKYGALAAARGRVQVEWSRAADERLVLRWTETGGPQVSTRTRKGFGSRVMEAMIRAQNGEMRFDWRAEGLACEIAFPTARGAPPTRCAQSHAVNYPSCAK